MAYGLDVTDLIYTDVNRVDVGTLDTYTVDLDLASSKDFKLVVDGFPFSEGFWYVDCTENGGVIDGYETSPDSDDVTYKGRSFRGILASFIISTNIDPDNTDDVIVGKNVQGEIHTVINGLLKDFELNSLFVCDYPDVGSETPINVNYTIISGTTLYDAIIKIGNSINITYKLRYSAIDKFIHIIPQVPDDYTDEMTAGRDDISKFKVSKDYSGVNHLICSGIDESGTTKTIHLFTDENGNVQKYAQDSSGNELTLDTSKSPQEDDDYILDNSQQLITGIREIQDYEEFQITPIENYKIVNSKPSNWSTTFGYHYTKQSTLEWSVDTEGHSVKNEKIDGVVQAVETFNQPFYGSQSIAYTNRKKGVKKVATTAICSFTSAADIKRFLKQPYCSWAYRYQKKVKQKYYVTITTKKKVKKKGKKKTVIKTRKVARYKWVTKTYTSKYTHNVAIGKTPNAIGLYYQTYDDSSDGTAVTIFYSNSANKTGKTSWINFLYVIYGGRCVIEAQSTTKVSWDPVKSTEVTTYPALNVKPANWNTAYSKYYTRSYSDNKWNYSSVSGESVIDPKGTIRRPVRNKPGDWTTNYGNYYYRYEDGKSSKTVEVQAYQAVSRERYVKLTTKPTGWNKNFSQYYTYGKKNKKAKKKTYNAVTKPKKKKYPAFKKNKYYLRESYSVPPGFNGKNCYLPAYKTVAPTFRAGNYFQLKIIAVPPAFTANKYYRKVTDNYAEMVRSGIERLEESRSPEKQNITVPDTDYNIGDLIGGHDDLTDTDISEPITNKVIKIDNGVLDIEYVIGGTT